MTAHNTRSNGDSMVDIARYHHPQVFNSGAALTTGEETAPTVTSSNLAYVQHDVKAWRGINILVTARK